MTGRKTAGFDVTVYEQLLVTYHPRPIRSEADSQAAQEVVDTLLAQFERSIEEEAVLDLVTTLIEEWERDAVRIPSVDAVDVIRFLLENAGKRQKDLVPIFGTESIVSEVLSGHRDLQRKQMAGFFHVSPAVFFGDVEEAVTERSLAGAV